jgi:DegV family protein with EDD domain
MKTPNIPIGAPEKIALIIDSCTDVPPEEIARHNMYVLPLSVNYRDASYLDKIEITPDEVYRRLETEVPTTSQPSPYEIMRAFEQIIADGYKKAVAVTISSKLSGTYGSVCAAARQFDELACVVIDTKNIGIGAGFTAIAAGELIAGGTAFCDIENRLVLQARDAKVYFSVENLKYLRAGGRIGEATYRLGSILRIRPIISCDDAGAYYTAQKVSGRKAAIKKTLQMAQDTAAMFEEYNIAAVHGDAPDEIREILTQIPGLFPRVRQVFTGYVSPVLVVHTGPGLVGIGVQGLAI